MPRRKRRTRRRTSLPKIKRMKKSRSEYGSDAQYIRTYYLRNKKYIDENISREWSIDKGQTPYEGFKELVEGQQEYTNPRTGNKYSVQEAIKKKMASKDMHKDWEAVDVYAHNFLQKIKSLDELKKNIIAKSKSEKISYEQTFYRTELNEKGEKVKVGYKKKITKLKENFSAYKIYFEGYFSVMGTDALIYSYDDVYIVEYKSPKKGTGATFDVIPKDEFMAKLGKQIVRKAFRKRGGY